MSAYKTNVTVSKEDKLIIIDGVSVNITDKALIELFNTTNVIDGWKFIHWNLDDDEDTFLRDIESEVNREYKNTQFNKEEYSRYVEPFISIWEKQKTIDEFVPEKTLEELKEDKLIDINNACNSTIVSGFESTALGENHFYYSTLEEQSTLNSLIGIGEANVFKAQKITLKDGEKILGARTQYNHTFEQLKQILKDGSLHIGMTIYRKDELEKLINSAETKEELEQISW